MAYRLVAQKMWGDSRFRQLPHGAPREVWFYLLTGNQTSILPGLQRCSALMIADETGLAADEVTEALKLLEHLGLIEVDPENKVIRLPKAPRYNPPANGKVIRAWFTQWEALPDSPLKFRHVPSLQAALPVFVSGEKDWASPAWNATFGRLPRTTTPGFGTESESIPNRIRTGSESVPSRFGTDSQDQDQIRNTYTSAPTGAGECDSGPPSAGTRTSFTKASGVAADAIEGGDRPPGAAEISEGWARLYGPQNVTVQPSPKEWAAITAALQEFTAQQILRSLGGHQHHPWTMEPMEPQRRSLAVLLRPDAIRAGLARADAHDRGETSGESPKRATEEDASKRPERRVFTPPPEAPPASREEVEQALAGSRWRPQRKKPGGDS